MNDLVKVENPTVILLKLSTGEEVLAQHLGKDTQGNLLLGHPGVMTLMRGAEPGKVNMGFQEFMPLKSGDNVSVNPDAIVATAPIDPASDIFTHYARAFLGMQVIAPPEKKLLLPH